MRALARERQTDRERQKKTTTTKRRREMDVGLSYTYGHAPKDCRIAQQGGQSGVRLWRHDGASLLSIQVTGAT